MLFDPTGKYNTNEQQQLDYLNNCITPLCELIEAEMLRKLFPKVERKIYSIKFDTDSLMRSDLATRGTYYKTLLEIGYTVNELRARFGASFPVKGGNEAYISTNLQQVSNPAVAPVDNKLKTDNKII
jgi:phage portal protein BeeE